MSNPKARERAKQKEAKARAKRRAEREQKRAEKQRALLLELLEAFMVSHYGDPAKGKVGAIVTGPVMATLSAAATLQAFLLKKADESKPNRKRKP